MKSIIFYGLIITFVSSLVIYGVIKENLLELYFSKILRFLESKETNKSIEEMCRKSPKNLIEFYKTTGPDYKFKTKNKGSETFIKITDMLFSQPDNIRWGKECFNFIFDNSILIFIFILIFLFAILWIPFTCCICCKICLCIPQKLLINYRYYIYATLVLCLAVLITVCIGFSKNSSILHGIFGFGCSFLKLGHHIIDGDEYKVKPYWSGITPVIKKLNETKDSIIKLADIVIDTNNIVKSIENTSDEFDEDLKQEYIYRKNQTIPNPEPGMEALIPEYIYLYGPTNNPETTLGKIQINLKDFGGLALRIFGYILNIIKLPPKLRDSLVNDMNDIVKNLDDNMNSIDQIIGDSIGDIDDIFDNIDEVIRKIMNAIFGINICLVIFVIISLVCLLFWKKGNCCLCCSWFIQYSFMFLTLLIGAVFLIIALFFQNLSIGILSFIENIKNKESSDFPELARDIIDCCFNGNGLLFDSNLFPEEFNSTVIEKIYSLESSLNEDINDLKEQNFDSIESAKEKYNEFKANPRNYIKQLQNSLYNIHKYIDIEVNDTKVDNNTPINDIWVLNTDECLDYDYNYLPFEKNNLTIRKLLFTSTNKKCLVITEWTLESIKERYKEIKSINYTVNISEEAGNYYNSITECLKAYNTNIDEMINKNVNYSIYLNNLRNDSIIVLENILKFIKPLRDSYREIVGEGSIFLILNCNFMKRDFNKLFQELYEEFGNSFRKTSDIFMTICFFQVIITLFLLFIISGIRNDIKPITGNKDVALMDIKEEPLTDETDSIVMK